MAFRPWARRWLAVCIGACLCASGTAVNHSWLAADEPARVLLVCQGPDGHPAATHEYRAGLLVLERCLQGQPGVVPRLLQVDDQAAALPAELAQADAAVFFLAEGATWLLRDRPRAQALQEFAGRGGGLVGLHWALGTRGTEQIAPFVELFGACHGGPDRRYAVSRQTLRAATPHPICRGLDPQEVEDEFYFALKRPAPSPRWVPLWEIEVDGQLQPVAWAWQRTDGGRSFGFTGLHFHRNWRLPAYRRLVAQGLLWTLDLPIPEAGVAVDVDKKALELPPPAAGPGGR